LLEMILHAGRAVAIERCCKKMTKAQLRAAQSKDEDDDRDDGEGWEPEDGADHGDPSEDFDQDDVAEEAMDSGHPDDCSLASDHM
jgi:hypothetical protein